LDKKPGSSPSGWSTTAAFSVDVILLSVLSDKSLPPRLLVFFLVLDLLLCKVIIYYILLKKKGVTQLLRKARQKAFKKSSAKSF
jgi:hypothetical protein